MKALYLVRHAKSSWDDPDLADFDRPLNDRGEKDAPRMGKRLKERDVRIDAIFSSPAVRAISTAEIIAEKLDFPTSRIITDPLLYHASEEDMLRILKQVSDKFENVMMVGHNPGLTSFANSLLGESIDNIPTCGIVVAEMDIGSWINTEWQCGKLISFDYPKK